MTIIWTSRDPDVGFEGGINLVSVDDYGQIRTNDGNCQVVNEPDPNLQCPNSKIIPIPSTVYKDSHALYIEATERAQVLRWGGGLNEGSCPKALRCQDDLYCGMTMRLSPDFRLGTDQPNNWCYLAELHGKDFPRFWALHLLANFNPPTLRLQTYITERAYLWTDTRPAPLGSEFTFIVHSVLRSKAEGGLIELWINRNPHGSPGPGEYIGGWTGDFQTIGPWTGGSLHAKVYQNDRAPKNSLTLYRMIAATTLEEVVDFLRPTPISAFNLTAALAAGGLTFAATGNPLYTGVAALISGLITKKT